MTSDTPYRLWSSTRRGKLWRTWQDKNRSHEEVRQLKIEKLRREIKKLKSARAKASIADGLVAYRTKHRFSRTQLAEMLGITRRALFNYETGKRSIGGDILEAIVKRGDTQLHEIFSVPRDPLPEDEQRATIHLAFDLMSKCTKELPTTDLADFEWRVISAAINWPKSRRKTEAAVQKEADRLIDDIERQDIEHYSWIE